MGVEVSDRLLTGAEAAALGDIGRYELVEGRIVRLSPTGIEHGKYEYRFGRALGDFVEQQRWGEVLVGEVGIYVKRNPDTVRGADVICISHGRLAQVKSGSFLDVAPELVVEIVSPEDRWGDLQRKVREYLAAGVDVVLVAEPETKTVTVYRVGHTREFAATDTLTLPELWPSFAVKVAELF